ncbi:GNAT family N-acetyltransferase [Chloroflexota bacterium]
MTDPPYSFRNYRPTDFESYVRLQEEAKGLEPLGRTISKEAAAERLYRPNYSPEHDLFVVERTGSMIGYMEMTSELDIGRIILNCWLCHGHRRRGLATELLECAMRRATGLGARVLHVNVAVDNKVARSALSGLGFKCVRRFFEFKLDTDKLSRQEMIRAAQATHHLKHGEEAKLNQIQNRCFDGTWGYNTNTVDTIAYRTHLSHFSPADVVLTEEADKVSGYCWTEITCNMDKQEGRIYMLGVDPDYRGKGIGKSLLLAGLAHLRSREVRMAVLTVDSENEVACALYRSLGFEVGAYSLWYEKAMTQAMESS